MSTHPATVARRLTALSVHIAGDLTGAPGANVVSPAPELPNLPRTPPKGYHQKPRIATSIVFDSQQFAFLAKESTMRCKFHWSSVLRMLASRNRYGA